MDWDAATDGVQTVVRDTFTKEATYMPSVGDDYTVQGVFDRVYRSIDPQSDVPIASTYPVFGVKLNDLQAEPTNSDEIEIDSIVYRIIRSEQDGKGWTQLVLHEE